MLYARDVLDKNALSRICTMKESKFRKAFGLERHEVPEQSAPDNFYLYGDRGSSVLFVAHLDTVGPSWSRDCHFSESEAGPVVHSRALDDRLGAYVGLDMLPKLGVEYDVLLTVGEESGQSTANYFQPSKQYDWVIEFDRGGTDVVLYDYEDQKTRQLVKDAGAYVGQGSFSDISYLDHLGVKAFNWGVGYYNYHGPRAHAYLDDTCDMVDLFMDFHYTNAGVYLPHYGRDLGGYEDDAQCGIQDEHGWLVQEARRRLSERSPEKDYSWLSESARRKRLAEDSMVQDPDYPKWWEEQLSQDDANGRWAAALEDEKKRQSDPFYYSEV